MVRALTRCTFPRSVLSSSRLPVVPSFRLFAGAAMLALVPLPASAPKTACAPDNGGWEGSARVRARAGAGDLGGGGGSGFPLSSDAVYFAPNDRLLRLPWTPAALAPSGPADTIAQDLPAGSGHTAKGIVLGKDGALYVSFGSKTNSCQPGDNDRKGPFPGANPCTELEQRAGVWRFDARKTHQRPADGKRWATGLRNPMSLSLDPTTGR